MKLDYSVPNQVTINMTAYIKLMLENFPQEELQGKRVPSPWTDNLFKVKENSPLLESSKAELFHTVVAQGLFVGKRGRPNISPGIAFLTTQVRAPTQEDWSKLVRLMIFLKQTVEDKLTLRADGTGDLRWYVDASFAVHPCWR